MTTITESQKENRLKNHCPGILNPMGVIGPGCGTVFIMINNIFRKAAITKQRNYSRLVKVSPRRLREPLMSPPENNFLKTPKKDFPFSRKFQKNEGTASMGGNPSGGIPPEGLTKERLPAVSLSTPDFWYFKVCKISP